MAVNPALEQFVINSPVFNIQEQLHSENIRIKIFGYFCVLKINLTLQYVHFLKDTN